MRPTSRGSLRASSSLIALPYAKQLLPIQGLHGPSGSHRKRTTERVPNCLPPTIPLAAMNRNLARALFVLFVVLGSLFVAQGVWNFTGAQADDEAVLHAVGLIA